MKTQLSLSVAHEDEGPRIEKAEERADGVARQKI